MIAIWFRRTKVNICIRNFIVTFTNSNDCHWLSV